MSGDNASKRVNQRNQLFDRLPQCFSQLDEPRTFVRLRMNLAGDSRPQNLVLVFQKLDVLREFVVARQCDQRQQWVEGFGSHAIFRTRY